MIQTNVELRQLSMVVQLPLCPEVVHQFVEDASTIQQLDEDTFAAPAYLKNGLHLYWAFFENHPTGHAVLAMVEGHIDHETKTVALGNPFPIGDGLNRIQTVDPTTAQQLFEQLDQAQQDGLGQWCKVQ